MTQSNSGFIAITGVGMVSSLGKSAATSCAAARGGISHPIELDDAEVWDEGVREPVPVMAHSVDLAMGFQGLGKLVRIGTLALNDLLSNPGLRGVDFLKTGFFVNLPSTYYWEQARLMGSKGLPPEELQEDDGHDKLEMDIQQAQYQAEVIPLLAKFGGIKRPFRKQSVYFKDQVGIIEAVQDAATLLRNGELEWCIIGGIDSYIDTDLLGVLSRLNLLKNTNNPHGFIPGEAASFFLIERLDTARARKAQVMGLLSSWAVSNESSHRFSDTPSNGVALAEAIGKALEAYGRNGREIELVIGNLNGDPCRAWEWSCALVRLRSRYSVENPVEWYPGASFGETGAASGAIAVSMAVRAFARNYARSDDVLVWLSSDSGLKGAFCIQNLSN